MKRLSLKILGGLIGVIILSNANMNIVMAAVTQSDIQNAETQHKNAESERKKAENELGEVQKEKTETQKQVDSLSSQIDDYENQIAQLDSQISDLNTKIKESEEKIKKEEENYTQQQDLLEKRLVATYEAGETSYLDFLLSSESITDFISNYYLVTEVATSDTELLEKIQKQKEEIEKAKTELEEDKRELDTSKASKQSITTQLQTVKNEKTEQVKQLSKDEQELQNEIDELKEHERNTSATINNLKNQYDQQMNPSNNSGNSSNNSGSSNSGSGSTGGSSSNNATSSYGFGWPVANNRIGTGYGVKGNMWSLGYHTGVDFPVSKGTPVYAVGNGQVVDTGYNSAYGNFVEIYHGKNVYSFYAHATSVQVSRGQTVSKGQQIMLSGATGNVSGPHLHFEIRSPGSGFYSCVNPMAYLP